MALRTALLWLGTVAFGAVISCAGSGTVPTTEREKVPPGKAGECAQCHLPEFMAAKDHRNKRPATCSVCHGQQAWKPTFLDHSWPLTGKHHNAPCFWCHKGPTPTAPVKFEGTTKLCVDCHRKEYQKAPGHEDFATTCEDCHSTKTWKGAKWPEKPPEPPPEPSTSVLPPASSSASVEPSASTPPKPKPPIWKPKPKPKPTPTPPDVTSHPSEKE